jgi:DNA-binding NarL/FixJ family response regulator
LTSTGLSINARELFRTFRGEISELAIKVRDDIYNLDEVKADVTPLSGFQYEEPLTIRANPSKISRNSPIGKLTKAETEILQLISTGATTSEIALSRHNSEATIKTQLTSIYRKLGVKNRVGAITFLRD